MPQFIDKKTIKLEKELNNLDLFVLDFVQILEKYTDYAVVSGYVALLFGRARATEDVDVIVPKMDWKTFQKFFEELDNKGFWCLNSSDANSLYNDYLTQNTAIRIAYKNKAIPNIELKFARNNFDLKTIDERIEAKTKRGSIFISRLEEEIAYKEKVLGSDKDKEDARFLRKVFKDILDEDKIEEIKDDF